MQNEDDLRGLAKVMDFMRALSILFVVINLYWFCYEAIQYWGINIGVVDKILMNFTVPQDCLQTSSGRNCLQWFFSLCPAWERRELRTRKLPGRKL